MRSEWKSLTGKEFIYLIVGKLNVWFFTLSGQSCLLSLPHIKFILICIQKCDGTDIFLLHHFQQLRYTVFSIM